MKNVKKGLKKMRLLLTTMFLLSATITSYGATATPVTAEQKWNQVIDFILPWINRLGGVIILIGAIEFAMAFKDDDAERKTKGLRVIIAGCLVMAVGLSSSTFLY